MELGYIVRSVTVDTLENDASLSVVAWGSSIDIAIPAGVNGQGEISHFPECGLSLRFSLFSVRKSVVTLTQQEFDCPHEFPQHQPHFYFMAVTQLK